ncbi:MAG: hypothetical protein JWL76_1648 [Thermoleophilia bacterium]|nr:hypothetical protein [Thermoleophilia bacterium]
MLARLVFSLVLGLLMYIPRPVPRPPVDSVPPTPDDLPPGSGDGDGVPPIGEPPVGEPPVVLPDIEFPDWPSGPGGDNLPSVPPTPPPGYEGDWPPASERPTGPKLPPTAPPGHTGPWNPVEGGGGDATFRERVREIIKDLRELLSENKQGKAVGDADEGVKKLGVARRVEGSDTPLDA